MIDSAITHSGRFDGHRPRADRDLAGPGFAVTRHQCVAVLGTGFAVALQVLLHFDLEGLVQHRASACEAQRIEGRSRLGLVGVGLNLDYVRHR